MDSMASGLGVGWWGFSFSVLLGYGGSGRGVSFCVHLSERFVWDESGKGIQWW